MNCRSLFLMALCWFLVSPSAQGESALYKLRNLADRHPMLCKALRIETHPWLTSSARSTELTIPGKSLDRADELITACGVLQPTFDEDSSKLVVAALKENAEIAILHWWTISDSYCVNICSSLMESRAKSLIASGDPSPLTANVKRLINKANVPSLRSLSWLILLTQRMLDAKVIAISSADRTTLNKLGTQVESELKALDKDTFPPEDLSGNETDKFTKAMSGPAQIKMIENAQKFSNQFGLLAAKIR